MNAFGFLIVILLCALSGGDSSGQEDSGAPTSSDVKDSSTSETLLQEVIKSGRMHFSDERWQLASTEFAKVIDTRGSVTRELRAEALFRYAYCAKKLGNEEDSADKFGRLMRFYSDQIEWTSQAFELTFEKLYDEYNERERILALLSVLRRQLYQWQRMSEEDAPSGALSRMRNRLPEVVTELKVTLEERREIDHNLGIQGESGWTEPKKTPAQQAESLKP